MSPASNQIAMLGSCVLSLILSQTLYRVFIWHLIGEEHSCHVHESSSPTECQMKTQQGVMKVTVGSEETRLLSKAYKCFSRNPAQVNDLNGVV